MINKKRRQKLEKNFGRMFWVQAFSNIKVLNVISTLFFLYRGLSLSEIFILSAIWGVASVLSEVPSSYLADRWGRKKTIIAGIVLSLIHWIIFIFANNFYAFIIGIIFASVQYSFFSGTDDAIIYDSNKELGRKESGLKSLGKYYSARSIFKIFAPLVGAFIAQNLLGWQFVVILSIDAVATVVAFIIACRLTEPNHYMDVEEMEVGVLKDAWKLIKSDKTIIRAVFSRVLVFLSMFIIWRFHQKFFVDIGVSILWLGVAWSLIHVVSFLFTQNIEKFINHKLLNKKINLLNDLVLLVVAIFVIGLFFSFNKYVFLFLFGLTTIFEMARWPLYSEFYNRRSKSFNRATTLSLANFVKGLLDPVILGLAAFLISKNINYPFILSLLVVLVVVLFFRLPHDNLKKVK